MPTPLSTAATRLGDAAKSFTIAQRTIAIIGVAVLVLGAFALTSWLSKPSLTPLFSGLSGEDASTIVDQLQTDGVPYELTNGGGTILVPEGSVYDQRIKAASAGLPSSSTGGYSLLDDMGVTSSEFQQSTTYKRALEGELAATVSAIDGVKTATVRLAIPEDTVFVAEQGKPTASVFVQTTPGKTLSSDQVQAITHLTSASIDRMDAADVAVIDATGRVLSAVGVGAVGGADQQSSDYEQRVQASVQTMLDRVLGAGNATVAVAADMKRESAERVEETFTTPEDAPALNESTTTEAYEGAGGGNAGILGPDNIAVPEGETNGDGTFNSESSTRNNAVNKTTESTTVPAGGINRQTVSVAVNRGATANMDVAALTALVSGAAGIDEARGDIVTVEELPFNNDGANAAADALAEAEAAAAELQRAELIRMLSIVAAVLFVVIVALIVYARRSRRQRREPLDLGELQGVYPAIPAPSTPAIDPAVALISDTDPSPSTTSIDVAAVQQALQAGAAENEVERMRAEIDALASQDPAKTAEFLRSMMDDRQSV
ncbi:flagellar M-ring protein FliF [Arthrobacter agilis]|uniref:flagellar basal-body MS-ring/collar protein FliF n=1 Tax=Arthrobacter agilis TaxID=37921 RepID=UPI000B36454C|nr:flagellar basal-body MS-ring/collar protein FliF [Arthrobacter agilis]OUM43735.1 flagellar M-ring protein FliF [Arthrobacter agilis]PPB46680.1 flagellar M-ring protein FliF [Arthrobacter agilis]TPV24977.1 flagellar M-ring protein FliF [Arthrobacter agilis]VDR31153.1 Flagellar M-ring protein [Arthrobacter agilis]